ncbi:MAG: AMP-binding protein [OCS116 cluster bacterium]|nr:AMP-binding protein [OCS116 cluster bacterium]
MIGGDEIVMGRPAHELLNEIPDRIGNRIWELIEKHPDKTVLMEEGRSWTYSQLGKAILAAKKHLFDHEVHEGDRVMMILENCCTAVAFLIAASDLNIWIAMINARMSIDELDRIYEDCDPSHLLFMSGVSPEAKAYGKHHGAKDALDPLLGSFSYKARLGARPEAHAVSKEGKDQVCVMIYTSGTTGHPKGVMLTHGNIAFIATVSGALRGLNIKDKVYAVLPISHIFGLASTCLGSLFAGSTIYLEPRFNPQKCLNILVNEKMTVLQGVPPMYSALIQRLKAENINAKDLSLRYMSVGGASLDKETKDVTENFFKLPLHNGYGLTETSPTVCQARFNENLNNCSVARPIPGVEIKLVRENGSQVDQGEIGELWVKGPNVMKGYFRKPEATKEVLNDAGWFNTQDLASQDEYGNVDIVGRTKEMIVRSGFNVYPAEVEAVLNAHENIIQSAVVGVPIDGDEDVIAYVQVQEGTILSEDELKAYCKTLLTAYKRPSRIIILHVLPASSTGKILKNELKARAKLLV